MEKNEFGETLAEWLGIADPAGKHKTKSWKQLFQAAWSEGECPKAWGKALKEAA